MTPAEKSKLAAIGAAIQEMLTDGSQTPVTTPTVAPDAQARSRSATPDALIHTLSPITVPAKGESYVDPVFGTSIKRITDAANTASWPSGKTLPWIEPEYSTVCPFSLDCSFLILVHLDHFGLYKGDGTFIGDTAIAASAEPRWSRTNPSLLYFHVGNTLKSYDAATNETKAVRIFSEYLAIDGKGESDISASSNTLVFCGDDREVFVYSIGTDSKGKTLDVTGRGVESLYLTADDQVLISWETGAMDLYSAGVALVRNLTPYNSHKHMGRDIDGSPILVFCNSNDPKPIAPNAIVKINLTTGAVTLLLSLDWSLALHVSEINNGFVSIESYHNAASPGAPWVEFTDELLLVKLDGTQVRRIAHHRSKVIDYTSQPKGYAKWDAAAKVWRWVFASNQGGAVCDTYLATVPQ